MVTVPRYSGLVRASAPLSDHRNQPYLALMLRLLMLIAHRVRRRLLSLTGRDTRGVKVMAFDRAGRVLLVRHAYGRSDLYMLPGGGIARGETPEKAAVRELREETGRSLFELKPLGRYESRGEGRRDIVFLFRASTEDVPVPNRLELTEAAFFPPDALPVQASGATRRRVEEWLGVRPHSTRW